MMRYKSTPEPKRFEQTAQSDRDEGTDDGSTGGESSSRVWEPIAEMKSEQPEYMETMVLIPDEQPSAQSFVYIPKIKPRRYSRKSEAEKVSVEYTYRRERNNDAVRKCRLKRKEEQELRDKQIRALQEEVRSLKSALDAKDARIRELETTVRNAAQMLCQKLICSSRSG